MAIHPLPRISCSLLVGPNAYIYNFSYSYVPQDGVTMSLYFVNELGEYNTGGIISMTNPVSITIDGVPFNMYALRFEKSADSKARTIRVDFIDETFNLSNYHVALTGQGCGTNVYQLGTPVDSRTVQERAQGTNATQRKIQDLTQFPDLEYTFDEFLNVVQQIFPTEITGFYDPTITKGFVGSFREVLGAWCSYFNLIYYFENNVLKITSPNALVLIFPQVPIDAISSRYSESFENTFTKTACTYFKQEGGQLSVPSQSAATDANSSITTNVTLYPIGYEQNLPQTTVDLYQVAAAMYGQQYWFLYNYAQGTAGTECGWTAIQLKDVPDNTSIRTTLNALIRDGAGGVATFDTDLFNERYAFYRQYGEHIAGRYYLSQKRGDIEQDQSYSWYDNSTTVNFTVSQLTNPVSIDYYQEGVTSADGIVPNTQINAFYNGVNANGNRLIYVDNQKRDLQTSFALGESSTNLISQQFAALTQGSFGSVALDYSEIGSKAEYIAFQDQSVLFTTNANEGQIPALSIDQINLFKPRFTTFNLKGVKKNALVDTVPDQTLNVLTTDGPVIISNTSTLKSREGSNILVYYSKYQKCLSESSPEVGSAFRHVYIPRQVSADIPVQFSSSKLSKSIYSLKRDLTFVNKYASSEILKTLATAQLETTKTLTFSLNYISPEISLTDFVSRGLSSFNIELSDQGMTATYVFSNSVLRVPSTEAFIEKLENNMKNSWVRKYNPEQSIGS